MERCSNVMMHRHLKCQRGKSEKMLKCDHESPFNMPAWKKWKNAQMWGWISRAYQMAIHHHIWAFFPPRHFKWRFIITFKHLFTFSTRAYQMAIHHYVFALFHFFHAGILNGDSSLHLSIFSVFPRGHFKWRFIIIFEHFFIFSARAF